MKLPFLLPRYAPLRKLLTMSVLLLGAGISAAAQARDSSRLAPDLLSIVVTDIRIATEWYRDRLGFSTVREIDLPERDSLRIVFLKRDSFLLELVGKRTVFGIGSKVPGYDRFNDPRLAGFNKVSFRVPDIEAWERRLKAKGVLFHLPLIHDRNFGLRTFIIADPDGNLVQFVQYDAARQ
ncbi:VOC family protein [Flaviaesturariibacter amylovorans]|uniref:VOC domain-containing protein n=1 Tax=Flaviaesturariibacter amylovorans TaxID=1084520 RepID=A0ABP8H7U3_9BACT